LLLKGQGIRRVCVCGLATDYCVKATALDARHAGFDVVVLQDAIRGVEVKPGDCAKAVKEMAAAGIRFATTTDLTA
jgi:nicotinamidase/pyrazinamidase